MKIEIGVSYIRAVWVYLCCSFFLFNRWENNVTSSVKGSYCEMMKFSGILNFRESGRIEKDTVVWIVAGCVMLLFWGLNLWYRFGTVFGYSRFTEGLFIFLGLCSVVVMVFPKLLSPFLFFFGVSFFLFGFRPYDIQSQVFETIVVFVAITVFFVNFRKKEAVSINRQLLGLLVCYLTLSLFSLMLLPLGHMVKDFRFFGPAASFSHMAHATPDTLLYSLGGINRLFLFASLMLCLAGMATARNAIKILFSGLFVGAVFCAFLGLLDYYGIVSLRWYRPASITGVLQSMFPNRGWLAEFILTVVPFALIGFMSKIQGIWWKIVLFGSLVVCETALILAGARAGWVSYPVILFVCWVFIYFFKDGKFESFHFGWRDLIKVGVSVPVTIVLSFLLIFQVLIPVSEHLKGKAGAVGTQKDTITTMRFIKKQAGRLVDSQSRIDTWRQGVNVWRESPVFGLGYESFCLHDRILSDIPESGVAFYKRHNRARVLDTPHNIFVQLLVNGGIAGLFLWLLIVGYTLMILIMDLIRNKRLLNIPVIISIISFHIYGIFQSMQYIPMIWSLIFLNLGYALTIDVKVLPERLRCMSGLVMKAMIFLVLFSGIVYFNDRGFQGLADKFGLVVYAKDQNWPKYYGFYPREKFPEGYYRWSGRKAEVVVDGHEVVSSGVVAFDVQCHTPGVDGEPVSVIVLLDGERIDEIVFGAAGSALRWYYIGKESTGKHSFLFEVSRTWNPKKMGISADVRDLGVAVSEPRFLERLPKDGVGFYGWEKVDVRSVARMTQNGKDEKRFRWTMGRASVGISDQWVGGSEQSVEKNKKDDAMGHKDGMIRMGEKVVFLMCAHPDIAKEPVLVRILVDGDLVRSFEFTDYEWKRVAFGMEELKGKRIVTYEVSRTWNPKRMGVSADGRDLGVAVAVP